MKFHDDACEMWSMQACGCGQRKAAAEELAAERARADGLEAKLAQYQKEAPLCDAHQPKGGARGNCVICGMMALSSALSRIDYICGEPNEMAVSGYDVHCDEEAVVKNVEALKAKLAEETRRFYWALEKFSEWWPSGRKAIDEEIAARGAEQG